MKAHSRLADWKPPSGWIPIPSAVQGIVVFGPPPEPEGPEAPIQTRCPSCGGTMAFDPKQGALVCGNCGNVGKKAEATRTDGLEFTLEALRRAEHGLGGGERKTLHCSSCGAEIQVEPGALATTCPFCASNQVELLAGSSDALRPGVVIPFKVDAPQLAKRAKEWLGQGWLHPGGLADLARIDRFMGVYVPFWLFDASVHSKWQAEVGVDREVSHTDSDGNTHSHTETDWSWRDGTWDQHESGVRIPGTARISRVIINRVAAAYELDGLCDYAPEVLAGFQAQSWDVALPEAWEQGKDEIRKRARNECESRVGGDRHRNFTMTAGLADETWRYALLPIWVSAYRYEGKVYQVMVNGQTGAVEGQKPVVWMRVYLLIALFFSPAVCSGIVGLPLLLVGVGVVVLVFALVFLVLGGIGAMWLWQRANELEAV